MKKPSAKVQILKGKDGLLRWRMLDESGQAIALRPGRVSARGLTGAKRKLVAEAIDRALQQRANGSQLSA